MWYINLDRSFYRFVTIHACDRQTDRRTDRQTDRILITIPRLHYMQRGKKYCWPIFTALHCMQRGVGDRKSVRPSVRPSVKRVNCDKTKETSAQILIQYDKEPFT